MTAIRGYQLPDATRRWTGRHYVVFAALWTIPAIAGTVDNFFWRRAHGAPVPLLLMALAEFPKWLIWIPLTPLIFRLGRRFPVAPPVRWQMVAVHVACCLALSVAQTIVVALPVLAGTHFVSWAALQSDVEFGFLNWLPVMLLAYPVVLGLGYAIDVDDRLRREQVNAATMTGRLAQAQLAALRTQLHPHMMFNSLNTAVSLVRTGDAALAVEVLTDLSEILRHVLRGAAVQEVPLSEELGFIERCVAIERVRFPDRVEAIVDVDWSVREALVPNMILQPLVENALRHGIRTRESRGVLEIAARPDNGTLVVCVRDNGPGFADLSVQSGLGLGITRERLFYLYGERASLTLRNRAPGGAEVELRLPLRARNAASATVSATGRSSGPPRLVVNP